MSRWTLASIIVGTGIACGALALAPAVAQDKADKETQSKSSQDRDSGQGDPEKRVDKAIESYEGRVDQDLEQARKDIDRLHKELSELGELQFTLAISLAELQAEMRAQSASDRGEGGGTAASSEGSDSEKKSSSEDQARHRLRTIELTRELRQVQENLRSLVQQRRNETDQFVAQLRNLRTQQRQAASERERNNKQAANQSKD
jgi:hypothetical protein